MQAGEVGSSVTTQQQQRLIDKRPKKQKRQRGASIKRQAQQPDREIPILADMRGLSGGATAAGAGEATAGPGQVEPRSSALGQHQGQVRRHGQAPAEREQQLIANRHRRQFIRSIADSLRRELEAFPGQPQDLISLSHASLAGTNAPRSALGTSTTPCQSRGEAFGQSTVHAHYGHQSTASALDYFFHNPPGMNPPLPATGLDDPHRRPAARAASRAQAASTGQEQGNSGPRLQGAPPTGTEAESEHGTRVGLGAYGLQLAGFLGPSQRRGQ
ncbi:hypothetical protein VTI74DRAFT_254 [Chaetomium olivicolor]